MNADHPEQLGDEHQQQDPRQALHHPLQRLLHHLVDRIVEIHSRQLVKEKTKGGDRGGGDDRRDQRGKRGRDVRRHGIRHFDLQSLAPFQPAVNLH